MNESTKELELIENKFKELVEVIPYEIDDNFAFSLTFARIFLGDTPNYKLSNGTIGATRSGWTYHTAFAIAQTCKMFNLLCKFESHGKRDAVIETNEDEPVIRLFAEWEWDYEDIFGKGKELDKLKTSCRETKTAEAFLLVYCPNHKYPDYLYKITEFWVKAFKRTKNPPSLFVHTIIFGETKTAREFEKLKTVVINPTTIIVSNELDF